MDYPRGLADEPMDRNTSAALIRPIGGTNVSYNSEIRTFKRSARRSTQYVLAQPVPRQRRKPRVLIQFRPRLMLQLQQVGEKRATPAFDVLPSAWLAGSITLPRLIMTLPKVFRWASELTQDNLVIVKSEDYTHRGPLPKKFYGGGGRMNAVGFVCTKTQRSLVSAEFAMDNGTTWTGTRLSTGSYEFRSTDSSGNTTTARWIPRMGKLKKDSWMSSDADEMTYLGLDTKWIFSLIDPQTKRHPVLAIMKKETLEVYDSYESITATTTSRRHSAHLPPEKIRYEPKGTVAASLPTTPKMRQLKGVTEDQKQLIVVTGSWIRLLQSGWPAPRYPKLTEAIKHICCGTCGASENCRDSALEREQLNGRSLNYRPTLTGTERFGEDFDLHVKATSSWVKSSVQQRIGRLRSGAACTEEIDAAENSATVTKEQGQIYAKKTQSLSPSSDKTHSCKIILRDVAKVFLRRPK